MLSRDAARSRSNKDPKNGKLVHAIESISKALYLDKSPSRSSSSLARNNSETKHISDDMATKDKKKSIWNWKSLKPLSHVRHQRFNCCFSLEVHSIEGLPSKFNDRDLCVHWERKKAELVTNPTPVNNGVAEFEEKLTHTCSISGSRNGPHHSVKYEAKHFLIYAAVEGNPKLDLGKHHFDLTRILPLTLEELEDGKSSGTGKSSFKLSGEAKGAVMNVSFGYVLLGEGIAPNKKNVLQPLDSKETTNNFVKFNQKPSTSRSMDDINILCEAPPTRVTEFFNSVNIRFQKLDEEQVDSPVDVKHEIVAPIDYYEPVNYSDGSPSGPSEGHLLNECKGAEFSFSKKGLDLEEKSDIDVKYRIEVSRKHSECSLSDQSEGNNVDKCEDDGFSFGDKGSDSEEKAKLDEIGANVIDENDEKRHEHTIRNEVIHDCDTEVKDICTKESLLEDLESVMSHVVELEKDGMDTSEARSESSVHNSQNRDKPRKMTPSHSFDDLGDDEFVSVVEVDEASASFNSDVKPDSPRECLLREFLKEAEATGCSLFGFDIDDDEVNDCYAPTVSMWEEFSEDSDSLPADQLEYPKIRANVMEDVETEELVEEWSSPPHSIDGLSSPIDLPSTEPSLPPLGEGLGPFIQTESGGFLRSMNPTLFRNAKSDGTLIMQVSSPIVVPTELGSGVMDVLQQLASMGLEKLSLQAKKMMPLEDITGNTMQQMAWEVVPQLEASKRQNLLHNEQGGDQIISSPRQTKSSSSSIADEVDSEYVSLEDLAPLAMDKIEELSVEGLRIQSGMSDEEAPSNITAQTIKAFSGLERKRTGPSVSMGLEGAAGLQLLGLEDSRTDSNDEDGLMSLSLTLDEWMRLDSGEIDEDQPSERISKLLAAHHANTTDLNILRGKPGKASKRRGLLGDNLTIALMVQLRDPSRDYEPVGTPMLALIQVERASIPPKPRIYCTAAQSREEKAQEDLIPQFKISEVHVAGLEAEPGKKKLWDNAAQQQSGSRWLLANRMGKGNNKNPFMKPKIVSKYPLPASFTSRPGDTLWSISGRSNGDGAKWKELAAVNPHIRNPNVILSNETIKLR